MNLLLLILALSPLAILASRVCSVSFLVRVALFSFACWLWRIKEEL